jgi:hypothetical protein
MKMAIGERLYYVIHADHPEMSGKLTGMFLEATDSLEDLALLLFSPASLKLLLSQALDVLSVRLLRSKSNSYFIEDVFFKTDLLMPLIRPLSSPKMLAN